MVILLINTTRSSNIFKYSIAFEYSVHNHGKSKIQIFVLEGGKSVERFSGGKANIFTNANLSLRELTSIKKYIQRKSNTVIL